MSIQIILNKKNVVSKNKFIYNFPKEFKFNNNDQVALKQISMYFSWFNISKAYNNNKIYYKWWDMNGDLTVLRECVIQDGYYSVNDLNEYLMTFMIQKGDYLETADLLNYIFFFEIKTNSVYYAVEIKLSSVSETFSIAHATPTTWKKPTLYETIEVIFPENNNFKDLLGFNTSTISQDLTIQPATDQKYSFLSTKSPNMEPSSSFLITSNLIFNEHSVPNNIISSFTLPNNIGFGEMVDIRGNDIVYSEVREGIYNSITLEILDQEYRPLQIRDDNILIVLSIIQNKDNKL